MLAASTLLRFMAFAATPTPVSSAMPVNSNDASQTPVNVMQFGAKADGVTDDLAAVTKAVNALTAAGGVVFFPKGSYAIGGSGMLLSRSNVTFRGAGMNETVLKRIAPAAPIAQSSASHPGQTNIAFEDLCFDWDFPHPGAANTAAVAITGKVTDQVHISRCRFWRSPGQALSLSGVNGALVEDCLFHSPGDARSTGISMTKSPSNITIRHNRFLYLENGIVLATAGEAAKPEGLSASRVTITDNYFDFGWWLVKELFSGEGASVHYSSTALTDAKAHFTDLSSGTKHNVRIMPLKQKGFAQCRGVTLSDVSARFVTNKVQRGDIVRAGGVFAVVAKVSGETNLDVEEWLSDAERLPVAAPASKSAYTVFGVYLGAVQEWTENGLTTLRWWDFNGKAVTPVNGTRYEVLTRHPNYPLHIEPGAKEITISNNTFRRGWSDQISMWGTQSTITGNMIEDGEDMGITLHGDHQRVSDNRISHQGAGGIWISANDSVIEANTVTDSQWVSFQNENTVGDIMIEDGSRNSILKNTCRRLSTRLGYYGIVVCSRSLGAVDNLISDNIVEGHLKADIQLYARPTAKVAQTVLRNNTGTVHQSGASGTQTTSR